MKNLILIVALIFSSGAVAADDLDSSLRSLQARKLQERARLISMKAKPKRAFAPPRNAEAPFGNDQAKVLVDEQKFETLVEMEANNLMSATLEVEPWSDSYWPIYSGMIANRYNDPGFKPGTEWEINERYLISHMGKGPVAHLSPAEKYDLLVGDKRFSLSRKMIEEGRPYFESKGKVETWMGICHGWAPASFMMKRPSQSVKVLAADGRTEIELFPSDIKALSSLLWATGYFETKFIGGRCNLENPPLDDNKRPLRTECRDTNPATWHMAVVNQIGVSRRSFVIDADWSFQVWNQPVVAYNYAYLDAKTGVPMAKLEEALLPIDESDKHRALRAPEAKNFVRVIMDLTYLTETSPTNSLTDSADNDSKTKLTYYYELELDQAGKIVGGEWPRNSHPDFLWAPARDAQVQTQGDMWLEMMEDKNTWEPGQPVPAAWRAAAAISTAAKQPLAKVVNKLVQWANK